MYKMPSPPNRKALCRGSACARESKMWIINEWGSCVAMSQKDKNMLQAWLVCRELISHDSVSLVLKHTEGTKGGTHLCQIHSH